ncbi:MAG: hypothetical protein V2A63_02765 [Patescibacteria group bacterium]
MGNAEPRSRMEPASDIIAEELQIKQEVCQLLSTILFEVYGIESASKTPHDVLKSFFGLREPQREILLVEIRKTPRQFKFSRQHILALLILIKEYELNILRNELHGWIVKGLPNGEQRLAAELN